MTARVAPMPDSEISHLLHVAALIPYNQPIGLTRREWLALKARYPTPRDDPADTSPRSTVDVFYGRRVVLVPERDLAP